MTIRAAINPFGGLFNGSESGHCHGLQHDVGG